MGFWIGRKSKSLQVARSLRKKAETDGGEVARDLALRQDP
jgi:hypothetical protein